MLQICSAISYFYLTWGVEIPEADGDHEHHDDEDDDQKKLIYFSHITSFLATAALALIWTMTIEAFPKPYRMNGIGICSGFGRIGGIAGIILGEYNQLPYSKPVIAVVGAMALMTAFLIRILPDMTREKMPKDFAEIESKIQGGRTTTAQENEA